MRIRIHVLVVALLGSVASVAGAAGSNPRDSRRDISYVIPPPVTERGEIGAWLGRLAGRYRADGVVWIQARVALVNGEEVELPERRVSVKGAGDCAAVGAGPGMQCIFNITWLDEYEQILDPDQGTPGVYNLAGGVSYLNPSMMLVGLDPGKQGVGFLLVDNKGLPEGGSGSIAGNRATLRAPCVNAPALFHSMNPDVRFGNRRPDTCVRITRIDARPGSTIVHLSIAIEINREPATLIEVTLRRAPPEGAERKR